jgi:hypothetical protein
VPDRSTSENKAVEVYLQFLATGTIPSDPKDETAIEVLDEQIANEPQLHRKVVLIARRHRLANPPPPDSKPLVDKFIQYAASFGERNMVTYAAWREMGVPPKVLKEAGIPATRLPSSDMTRIAYPKMDPDDPHRKRPYKRRRTWHPEERAEFFAYLNANGDQATAEKYDYPLNYIPQLVLRLKAKESPPER